MPDLQSSEENLELPHSRADHPWELRIQRAGWLVFAGLILAALVGFLGQGPLSSTTSGDPQGALWVEYNRFERYQGPADLRIHLKPETIRTGEARIWIDRSIVEHMQIERIEPRPERTELGSNRHTLVFAVPGLTGQTSVIIRYRPDLRFGWIEGQIGAEVGPAVPVRQFIYP